MPFDQQRSAAEFWFVVYSDAAVYLVAPVLLAVALFLRVMKDSQATHTVAVLLVASPAAIWICVEAARWPNGTGASGRGFLTLGLAFALATGVLRAVVVALRRRTGRRTGDDMVQAA